MFGDEVTLAELLGRGGYRSGIFGKWHLGDNYPMRQSRRQGRITRTGNRNARWILVESAWSYRFSPRMGVNIRKRNEAVAPEVKPSGHDKPGGRRLRRAP